MFRGRCTIWPNSKIPPKIKSKKVMKLTQSFLFMPATVCQFFDIKLAQWPEMEIMYPCQFAEIWLEKRMNRTLAGTSKTLLDLLAQYYTESCVLTNSLDLVIQGVSHWNVSFKMALTDRNMTVRFCLKVFVYSRGLEIWVSSTTFQKISKGWPQQPPKERVPYISENLDFWWSIPQKRTGINHFDAIDD